MDEGTVQIDAAQRNCCAHCMGYLQDHVCTETQRNYGGTVVGEDGGWVVPVDLDQTFGDKL